MLSGLVAEVKVMEHWLVVSPSIIRLYKMKIIRHSKIILNYILNTLSTLIIQLNHNRKHCKKTIQDYQTSKNIWNTLVHNNIMHWYFNRVVFFWWSWKGYWCHWLHKVFVLIAKCICLNCARYLSESELFFFVMVVKRILMSLIAQGICLNRKMYLS